jgi:hypothetical protein
MGWLKGVGTASSPSDTRVLQIRTPKTPLSAVDHVEYIALPDQSTATLPFIDANTVNLSNTEMTANGQQRVWIVVDNIVYDCTEFADMHPGGYTVIQSFAGKDCSWQFWRFHNTKIMESKGGPLRIGRTKDVRNPYKEKPRFVGLRKLGNDDWN